MSVAKELGDKIMGFLNSRDNVYKDEFYGTEKEMCFYVFENFLEFATKQKEKSNERYNERNDGHDERDEENERKLDVTA